MTNAAGASLSLLCGGMRKEALAARRTAPAKGKRRLAGASLTSSAPIKATGKLADTSLTSSAPPHADGLHARATKLEARALAAESRLAELRTAFKLYAAQSRQQTSALLNALDGLLAEKQQREAQAP